tara:strand:- start:5041 stop:5448 length:408 start_codon:yes stop_codon:yes gene_type:complete
MRNIPNLVQRNFKSSTVYVSLLNVAYRQLDKISALENMLSCEQTQFRLNLASDVIESFKLHVEHVAKQSTKTPVSMDVFDTKVLIGVKSFFQNIINDNKEASCPETADAVIRMGVDFNCILHSYMLNGRVPANML